MTDMEKGRFEATEVVDADERMGCGNLIGSCGHTGHHNIPVYLKSHCGRCGKAFSVSCTSSTCTGRNFYC